MRLLRPPVLRTPRFLPGVSSSRHLEKFDAQGGLVESRSSLHHHRVSHTCRARPQACARVGNITCKRGKSVASASSLGSSIHVEIGIALSSCTSSPAVQVEHALAHAAFQRSLRALLLLSCIRACEVLVVVNRMLQGGPFTSHPPRTRWQGSSSRNAAPERRPHQARASADPSQPLPTRLSPIPTSYRGLRARRVGWSEGTARAARRRSRTSAQ